MAYCPVTLRCNGSESVVEICVGERHDVRYFGDSRLQVIRREVEDDAPRVPKHPDEAQCDVAAVDRRKADVARHFEIRRLVKDGVVPASRVIRVDGSAP